MSLFLFKIILTNKDLAKKIFLVQTDTTVGFLSQNAIALSQTKMRPADKPFVQVLASYKVLKTFTRIPPKHKNKVRRAKKTTYVYANNMAIRVVKDVKHVCFVKPFEWFYSSSANESTLSYDKDFAILKSDIIVEDNKGLFEDTSSSIYRLKKNKMQRLR